MRRRHRHSAPPGPSTQGFHHHPFRYLAAQPGRNHRSRSPTLPAKPNLGTRRSIGADNEEDVFRREMADVQPLPGSGRVRVSPLPPTPAMQPVTDPDAEVVAELSELIAGTGDFDITNTTEFTEGAVVGLDRRLVRRLRNGEFAYQSHLDLHGLTAEQARTVLNRFLAEAHQRGHRCVLIVHGRGRNSKDQFPVLKHRLSTWLARGAWARLVLAFTSARPCDGGAGALYVLLRRQRHAKRPIHVTQGARW